MRSFRRIIWVVAAAFLVLCSAIPPASQTVTGDRTLILAGGKIYTSPTVPPIANGVLLVQNGKIAAVGKSGEITLPADAQKIDCAGLVITAGFQNSHVHFTEQKWDDAAHQPAPKLSQQLVDMLTRYGVTTAVDLSSFLANTVALRARVESEEIAGPRILTAGGGLFPPDGIPYYVRESLPPETLKFIAQPSTPDEAVKIVDQEFAGGSDLVKLFTGSLVSRHEVKPMPLDIARAEIGRASC